MKDYNKNVFEGEECSINNPKLYGARIKNHAEKFDYEKKELEEKRKRLFELANRIKPKDKE